MTNLTTSELEFIADMTSRGMSSDQALSIALSNREREQRVADAEVKQAAIAAKIRADYAAGKITYVSRPSSGRCSCGRRMYGENGRCDNCGGDC